MIIAGIDIYTLIRVATILASIVPAIQDMRTRLIDDRMWLIYSGPYAILIYSIYLGAVRLEDLYVGITFSIIIVVIMLIVSRFGLSLGEADYIMFIVIAPLSFVFKPRIGDRLVLIPGFIQILFLSSLISIFYVILKCIYINFHRFSEASTLKEKFRLLYGYWVEDADDLKEIIIEDRGDKKFVTPGIPMISFILLSMVILTVIDLLL